MPGTQQTFVVTAQGLLTKPEEFEDIIVRAAKEGTAIVRVRDIGRVELDKRDYSIVEPDERQDRDHDRRSTSSRAPTRWQTRAAVRKRMEELKAQFPTGLDYRDRRSTPASSR